MGRAVFSYADRVMRENISYRQVHERGKTHCVFHVIGENKEGSAVRTESAVQLHTVGDCRHGMFANSEMDIGTALVGCGKIAAFFHVGFIGRREVC